jgi:hypothetical protein
MEGGEIGGRCEHQDGKRIGDVSGCASAQQPPAAGESEAAGCGGADPLPSRVGILIGIGAPGGKIGGIPKVGPVGGGGGRQGGGSALEDRAVAWKEDGKERPALPSDLEAFMGGKLRESLEGIGVKPG